MNCREYFPRKSHPKDESNIFSQVLFLYTAPLFFKGVRKDLKEEDIYEAPKRYKSKSLVKQLTKKWEVLKQIKKNSVFQLLLRSYGLYYFGIGIFKLFVTVIVLIFQPIAISKLVSYFVPNQREISKDEAWLYAVALVALKIFNSIAESNSGLWTVALGVRIRAAIFSLIYKKIMKIDFSKSENAALGKIVTHLTKDVRTMEFFLEYGNEIWIIGIRTIMICVMLYLRIGTASLAGIAILVLIIPFQIYAVLKTTFYERKMCERTEVRYRILKEVFSVIKLVKMYTWEQFFEKNAEKARKKEVSASYALAFVRYISVYGSILGIKIAQFVLFVTFVKLGNQMNAKTVFFIVANFRMLNNTFGMLILMGLLEGGKLAACMQRINTLMIATELTGKNEFHDSVNPLVQTKNLSLLFNERNILKNFNLMLKSPSFVIITGSTSCGKTTLLKMILGEVEAKGHLNVQGSISYASQEPWLFPSTIKQNILFGQNYDQERYHQVLRVCALDIDFESLEKGDSTILVDGGINLSKGQRCRINLARAVYRDSDIYLIDDSLSSLDSTVSTHILEECFCQFLQNKLVILVTQNESHFGYADKIINLDDKELKDTVRITDKNDTNVDIDAKVLPVGHQSAAKWEESDEQTSLLSTKKIYSEEIRSGQVSFTTYNRYLKAGGLFFILGATCFLAAAQVLGSFRDKFVQNWSNLEEEILKYPNDTKLFEKREKIMTFYGSFTILGTLSNIFATIFFLTFGIRGSIHLHKQTLKIFYSPMKFYDSHFAGNILNRFSKDFFIIDDKLSMFLLVFLQNIFVLIGIFVLIASVNIFFLLPSLIFIVILIILRNYYLKTTRNLRRLDCATRSPIIGYINSTIEGIVTIRACKTQDILVSEFHQHQDLLTSVSYTLQTCQFAFTFVIKFLSAVFFLMLLIKFLVFDDGIVSPGGVGLALSQASMLVMNLLWAIIFWTDTENNMTSVERILEYADNEKEERGGLEKTNWLNEGEIKLENVFLTYPNTTEPTLKDLNFSVRPGEKVGIVGRTGAGKSSIFSILFRLYDYEGKITIDEVNTKTLNLDFLRSKISVVPQDAVIFTGTVRDNIDPKRQCSDEELWKIIHSANLSNIVSSLDSEILDGGFSAGQKQLFSLARAIASKNKIVLLDEATANLDSENTAIIQNSIQTNFATSTVLTIIHNLNTVLHCDKILVLDKGRIVESGPTLELLHNKDGILYNIYKTGLKHVDY